MSKNIFNTIQVKKPNRNVFDLTHDVKQSAKMGELIPCMVMECLPGDKVIIGCDTLLRFAPLIAPVMHRMDVTIHYFFVPNRLSWDGWEEFISNSDFTAAAAAMPYIAVSDGTPAATKRYLNYFGIPKTQIGNPTANVQALPFAAYQRIYNDYYRDENLITEVDCDLVDGNNSSNVDLFLMRYRAWEHDYFTAALPFAQKGAVVDIPLGDVVLNVDGGGNPEGAPRFVDEFGDPSAAGDAISGTGGRLGVNSGVAAEAWFDPAGSLSTQPTTINDLRRAYAIQDWLEKNARGGTRYSETILMHFGVRSSDARLQRPEYITGVKSPVIISEVLNTTGEDGGLPQGNMAGHAVSVQAGKSGSYFCEEHGYIIGIMSVMPKPAYQQGIPKHFLKNDPLDFFWGSFAHLGEQPVLNQELYAYTATMNETFGYVPRYAEYRYIPSRVAGDFTDSLDYWHLGRIFSSQPALNQAFIECKPADVARIFAVTTDDDNLYMHILHRIKAIRPLPKFGTPGK